MGLAPIEAGIPLAENPRPFNRVMALNKTNKLLLTAFIASAVTAAGLLLAETPAPVIWTVVITLFTAILWVTEAIPIPATSLIPFVGFPLAGVISHKEAASAVGSHVILLLMGAFILSKALEKSGVHRRFALYMLGLTGRNSAKGLVLGFMLTAAILSMWISNTATTLMLLPIALAIIESLPKNAETTRLATVLLLGIAYAASVGGTGTPIGTPPNIIFMSVYEESVGGTYSFIQWMKTGVPLVLVAVPLMALWLTRGLGALQKTDLPVVDLWSSAERRVIAVFAIVAVAWMTRPWWAASLGLDSVGDSTIALAGVVAMFCIPSGDKDERLLDWDTAVSIPWGMLLLFAGGICIAKAFAASGLSEMMSSALGGLASLPLPLLVLSLCLAVSFLTEITSNTATATLLMPILALVGNSAGIPAHLLMIPAVISASCAFMLPVATAPNAIVYGAGNIPMKTMAREGIGLNVIVAVVTTAVCLLTL